MLNAVIAKTAGIPAGVHVGLAYDFFRILRLPLLAHEIGHIKSLDSYKLWRKFQRDLAEDKELAADRFAAELVGCDVWRTFVERHHSKMMNGYLNEKDPHPHPNVRRDVCVPPGENSAPQSAPI